MISSSDLFFRVCVDTSLIKAIKSVHPFVVMRATSATDGGGTGCFVWETWSSIRVSSPASQMVILDFVRSTRNGIGVEMNHDWRSASSRPRLAQRKFERQRGAMEPSRKECLPRKLQAE